MEIASVEGFRVPTHPLRATLMDLCAKPYAHKIEKCTKFLGFRV